METHTQFTWEGAQKSSLQHKEESRQLEIRYTGGVSSTQRRRRLTVTEDTKLLASDLNTNLF